MRNDSVDADGDDDDNDFFWRKIGFFDKFWMYNINYQPITYANKQSVCHCEAGSYICVYFEQALLLTYLL